MCDFNALSEEEKLFYHTKLLECTIAFGGKNFFLQLLELIRQTKPHPLTSRDSQFSIHKGVVLWNKVIFNDKLQLLLQARLGESRRGNILPDKSDKSYKKVLNLVKTFSPIEFTAKPRMQKDGKGFKFKAFDTVDDNTIRLNPVFDAVFFCSVETIKKILNSQSKE